MHDTVKALKQKSDALEKRNISLISTVSEAHNRELEVMSDVYSTSTGRGLRSRQAGSNERGLPSLVDVAKCTSDQVRRSHVRLYFQIYLLLLSSTCLIHVHEHNTGSRRSSRSA